MYTVGSGIWRVRLGICYSLNAAWLSQCCFIVTLRYLDSCLQRTIFHENVTSGLVADSGLKIDWCGPHIRLFLNFVKAHRRCGCSCLQWTANWADLLIVKNDVTWSQQICCNHIYSHTKFRHIFMKKVFRKINRQDICNKCQHVVTLYLT